MHSGKQMYIYNIFQASHLRLKEIKSQYFQVGKISIIRKEKYLH